MFHGFFQTLVKVIVASLIVGTIMAHFGITADQVIKEFGLSQERVMELTRQAVAWALPNLVLGAIVIVPVWFVIFLFRPPRPRSDRP
jgi:hypothetical protein